MQCFRVGYRLNMPRVHLGECVYEENTSDKWSFPLRPTRKHCMPKPSENLRKFSEELRNLREFPKTSGMPQTRFEKIKRFMKILEDLWQSSQIFGKLRKWSKMVLNFSENLRKYSGIFGKLRKRFKSIFQMILFFFKIF